MKKLLLVATLLFSIGAAQAGQSIRWNNASLLYQSVDVDGEELTGIGLSGTKLVSDKVFLTSNYTSVSDSFEVFGSKVDLDLNTLALGLGYRYEVSNTTDLYGVFSYRDVEAWHPIKESPKV